MTRQGAVLYAIAATVGILLICGVIALASTPQVQPPAAEQISANGVIY